MTGLGMGLLLGVLAAFVGLDGIGRGSVLRAVTGTAGRPRDDVLAATGPPLLLGHVWLIAAAGLLVGLFPRWESAVVSHAYWWVLAIVAGLVLRVAAIGTGAFGTRVAPVADAPGTRPTPVAAAPGTRQMPVTVVPGTRRPTGTVLAVTAGTGALATAAGTGGFLAAAAGVWPVLGAVAVVALDLVLGGWWLGAPTPRRASVAVGVVLSVPAAVLMTGGAITGGAAVLVLAMAGALLGVRHGGLPAAALLTAAAVAPLAARWPDLAVPGSGAVPVAELAAGPVSAALVTGVAGPAFAVVLGVQAWFWWDRARAVRG